MDGHSARKKQRGYIHITKNLCKSDVRLLSPALPELVSKSKVLTGRNLTMLTRKRQREITTKKYWWKQPQVCRGRERDQKNVYNFLVDHCVVRSSRVEW